MALIHEETRSNIREERLNLRISAVAMQASRADMHADRGGCGQERDSAEMALATEAFTLEATGNRASVAVSYRATIGEGHGWSLARMSRVASHEALPQPHILIVRHEFMRRILNSTWRVTSRVAVGGAAWYGVYRDGASARRERLLFTSGEEPARSVMCDERGKRRYAHAARTLDGKHG